MEASSYKKCLLTRGVKKYRGLEEKPPGPWFAMGGVYLGKVFASRGFDCAIFAKIECHNRGPSINGRSNK